MLSLASSAKPNSNEANLATTSMDESTLWHARLGHVAHDRIAALNKVAEGVPPDVSPAVSDGPCEGWVCGQMCVSKCARTSESVVVSG